MFRDTWNRHTSGRNVQTVFIGGQYGIIVVPRSCWVLLAFLQQNHCICVSPNGLFRGEATKGQLLRASLFWEHILAEVFFPYILFMLLLLVIIIWIVVEFSKT